ncbi:MAG: LicD family protein [Clostridia bacterium]|nr:LicD family protein [Clostridia bacterium]
MDQNIKLEDIWKVELEILDEIDRVCTENGLRYSLAYGTLLGAVRHKGFIPWDDDIDIMMPREDYEKFKTIWRNSPPNGFILQDETVEDDSVNNFTKIRKDHTTFLQFDFERTRSIHKGFFVDIFPADRQASGRLNRKIQKVEFLLSLLYNRGYPSGKPGAMGIIDKTLLMITPKCAYRKLSVWFGKRGRRWNHLKNNHIIFPATPVSCNKLYPAGLFDDLHRIEFQGKEYEAVKDYDGYLSVAYRDYKTLPPENKRVWTHHPILVDFNRNYEEITEEEKHISQLYFG